MGAAASLITVKISYTWDRTLHMWAYACMAWVTICYFTPFATDFTISNLVPSSFIPHVEHIPLAEQNLLYSIGCHYHLRDASPRVPYTHHLANRTCHAPIGFKNGWSTLNSVPARQKYHPYHNTTKSIRICLFRYKEFSSNLGCRC